MKCLLFISLEPWDDIWRRNQFVSAELARRGWHIHFIEPARDISNALRHGRFSQLRRRPHRQIPGLPNVTLDRPDKWWPSSCSVGRALNGRGLVRFLSKRLRQTPRPVLWINDHAAAHCVGRLTTAATVYDITDDWTTSGQSPAVLKRIAEQDRLLCEKADAVIVCSQRLYDLKRPLVADASRLHLIANGVDAAHYEPVSQPGREPPEASTRWPRPVFGYTGTVHRDRMDLLLLGSVARLMTRGTLVLLGPCHLNERERADLTGTGRVVLQAPVPYADIPRWMAAMDVMIVPHHTSAFVQSLNPIKLWEYLAGGKPIVSTRVAGFAELGGPLVRLAEDAQSFVKQMDEAAAEGLIHLEARRSVARGNSWADRVDAIERVLRQAITRAGRRT